MFARLLACVGLVTLSILLSGCVTKHPPKSPVIEAYKLGRVDGYNAAIDYPHRMIDFAYYSYHANLINLTLPEAEQKKIHNKTVEYQRGFTNGWKVSNESKKYVSYSITHSNPPVIIEHDGTRDGIIVPNINHRTKIREYERKPQ